MGTITESDVEQAALDILEELDYKTLYGPDIAPPPEGTRPERKNYSDVVLVERLTKAIDKLNPTILKWSSKNGHQVKRLFAK